MSPKDEALAFRIWAYCDPRGWDCTHGDAAEALGVPYQKVARICTRKGWSERLRVTVQANSWVYQRPDIEGLELWS